jgi:hypothetical protein
VAACSRGVGEYGGAGWMQGPGDMRYYYGWDEPAADDEGDAHAGAAFKVPHAPLHRHCSITCIR